MHGAFVEEWMALADSGLLRAPRLAMEVLDAGRLVTSLTTYLIVTALSALIATCVTAFILRFKVTNLERYCRDHEKRIKAIEVSCPEHRGRFVTKDEIVRIHSAINSVGEAIRQRLDEVDAQNEKRAGVIHGRVNEQQEAVGRLRGQVETHLREHKP